MCQLSAPGCQNQENGHSSFKIGHMLFRNPFSLSSRLSWFSHNLIHFSEASLFLAVHLKLCTFHPFSQSPRVGLLACFQFLPIGVRGAMSIVKCRGDFQTLYHLDGLDREWAAVTKGMWPRHASPLCVHLSSHTPETSPRSSRRRGFWAAQRIREHLKTFDTHVYIAAASLSL